MKVGDWVQVKLEAEILGTLDARGTLDGMPFMPEMLRYCGRCFQVYKRAHKTCDSIKHQARRVAEAVHLETRCSGEAHGGCQAGCLLFWKEAWLQPVDAPPEQNAGQPHLSTPSEATSPQSRRDALQFHCISSDPEPDVYRCQATQIREASTPLHWWEGRQYIEDLQSGNVSLREFAFDVSHAFWLALLHILPWPEGLVPWVYERLRLLWRGVPFPRRIGTIPKGQRTPCSVLNLVPGELVRVRSIKDIDATLDCLGQNRGLYFDSEQVPYADRTFRVLRRVEKIISEDTGKMLQLKAPTVILDSAICHGQYSSCRVFCPRSAYLLWREAWLERCESERS